VNEMSERVLGDNVLVTERKEAGETQTAGGIILSGDLSTGNKPALVLAVGPDVTDVKSGDVCYLKWSEAMPVELEGVKCGIIAQEFIKMVVDA
jgi:co-chaperonin GroES (HSP10)|tara:strand:+ start:646 stop:924 length:279 start_codon:yes stop_codon:yes gene_type:complete